MLCYSIVEPRERLIPVLESSMWSLTAPPEVSSSPTKAMPHLAHASTEKYIFFIASQFLSICQVEYSCNCLTVHCVLNFKTEPNVQHPHEIRVSAYRDRDPRIRASDYNESGSCSGSCSFHQWLSRCKQKTNFIKFFCLILFEGTFTSLF